MYAFGLHHKCNFIDSPRHVNPFFFFQSSLSSLGNPNPLLRHPLQTFTLDDVHPSASQPSRTLEAALTALNQSYAPYTQCYAGVCVTFDPDVLVGGSYYESAAFNPSVRGIISRVADPSSCSMFLIGISIINGRYTLSRRRWSVIWFIGQRTTRILTCQAHKTSMMPSRRSAK